MSLLKKKCAYCGIKIDKNHEVFRKVKVPEFNDLREKPFCSEEHADLYRYNVKGTPSKSSCPYCAE